MKRMLAVFLALALLLTTFAACGKKKPSAGNNASEYELLYAPVLKKYKQAFDEGWSGEKFAENNLSPKLANLDKTAAPSFAFFDLNGDKTPELFIGRADQRATVYDMYTAAQDNTIRQLVVPTDETVPTLTDDNRLVKPQNSYAHLDVVTYYKLEGDALTPADSYIHDAGRLIDGTDAWFHATGDLPASESEFYAEDMDVITEAEYNEKTTYTTGELAMKSFADLMLPDDTADAAEATQTTETPADPMEAAKAAYAPIMDQYKEVFALGTNEMGEYNLDALTEKGLNIMFGLYFSGTPGYAFVDLDKNGTPELIVGRCAEGADNPASPFAVYTVKGSDVKLLTDVTLDYRGFTLYEGGYIFEDYIDAENTIIYYRFKNGELEKISEDEFQGRPDKQKLTVDLMPFDTYEPASEPATEAPAQDSDMTSAKVGDYITFGHYEQDNNTANGPEPIEWLVLDTDGNQALVISKYGLDCQPYNTERTDVTWETCTLRTWLNNDFYNSAFSAAERNKVQTSMVKNDDNPERGTPGGNDTKDKLFLLSIDKANTYFSSGDVRKCVATAYATAKGAYQSDSYTTTGGAATCWWWLRSPGGNSDDAARVHCAGFVETAGYGVHFSSGAVRPAMWIIVDA